MKNHVIFTDFEEQGAEQSFQNETRYSIASFVYSNFDVNKRQPAATAKVNNLQLKVT